MYHSNRNITKTRLETEKVYHLKVFSVNFWRFYGGVESIRRGRWRQEKHGEVCGSAGVDSELGGGQLQWGLGAEKREMQSVGKVMRSSRRDWSREDRVTEAVEDMRVHSCLNQ